MFFLLRIGLVVGAVFYFSPVRTGGIGADLDLPAALRPGASDRAGEESDAPPRPRAPKPAPEAPVAPSGLPDEAERLWRGLPQEARQAVLERLRAEAAAALTGARPPERQPAGRAEAPPRRP